MFLYQGIEITNPTLSSCGRFTYSKKQSMKTYNLSKKEYESQLKLLKEEVK